MLKNNYSFPLSRLKVSSANSTCNTRGASCAELLFTYLSLTYSSLTLIEILLSVKTVYVGRYDWYLSGPRTLLSGEATDVRGCMFDVCL